MDRVSTNLDEFWANLDYTIYDSGKLVRTKSNDLNALHENAPTADHDSLNANCVRTDQSHTDSVVIDLVTNLNNNNATNKSNTKFNRKLSTECGSGSGSVNNNLNNNGGTTTTSNYDRTKSLSHGENIVIKKEQIQTITDFDNCLESINNNINNRNSSSSNLSEALTPSLTRIISQGIQNKKLINSNNNNNLNSSLNSGSSLFRHPSDARTDHQLRTTSSMSSTVRAANSDSKTMHGDHFGSLRGEITEGINGETIDHSILDESVVADHQLYAEMFGDWLHFRPKTPDDDQFDSEYGAFGDSALPFFAENTSLSIELQRLTDLDTKPPPLTTTVDDPILTECPENVFVANPFSLNDVTADERSAALLNDSLTSAMAADGNVSDPSLPEPSLSLGENEENDKILDNLLEECQLDDLKTNANFWNGLLDDSGGLLDTIDDKNHESDPTTTGDSAADSRRTQKRKFAYRPPLRLGYSAFNVSNLNRDEKIFKKCDPNAIVKSTQASTTTTATTSTTTCNESTSTNANGVANAIVELKKEIEIGADGNAIVVDAANNAINVAVPPIKIEPVDEPTPSSSVVDEQHLANVVKPQILPVIKTEVVNSLPVVSTAVIPRPITLQQANQLQQQQAQLQQSQTGDQTFVLSSRPIRRFTTNGPTDGKAGKCTSLESVVDSIYHGKRSEIILFCRRPTFADQSQISNGSAAYVQRRRQRCQTENTRRCLFEISGRIQRRHIEQHYDD